MDLTNFAQSILDLEKWNKELHKELQKRHPISNNKLKIIEVTNKDGVVFKIKDQVRYKDDKTTRTIEFFDVRDIPNIGISVRAKLRSFSPEQGYYSIDDLVLNEC